MPDTRPHIENLVEMRRYRFTLSGGGAAECVEGAFTGIKLGFDPVSASRSDIRLGARVKERNAKGEVFLPWGRVVEVAPLAGGV
jgi:hypothetical protein